MADDHLTDKANPVNAPEQTVLAALAGLGVAYRRVAHAPAMTMDDLADIDRQLGVPHAKNLFLCNRQQTAFYLLLLPGDKNFRTAVLSRQLGVARLSFAGPEPLATLLGTQPGAVSPLGLLFDRKQGVRLLIDRDLAGEESFCFHPCSNTASLVMASKDFLGPFLRLTGHAPTWVDLSGAAD
ncbi:MAG: prolyl-tRNA synthetase associated domain-containing protein [Clostridiaceae bacterium]|nr:prolyl-tRNA synthetase associated domain-containing protein [Clostridiaceae bacterium]